MKKGIANSILRQKAENRLKQHSIKVSSKPFEPDMLKIIHELKVHQIELELQNEELLKTRTAAQDTADKYAQLYDFAPTGYFTLSKNGQILELNLCGAQMLGKDRQRLINSRFGFFVSVDTRPVFNTFLDGLFKNKTKESCEVSLATNGSSKIYVNLTGIMTENTDQCLINLIDITEGKQAVEAFIESQRLIAIGEMASSVAHDFNNSLQSITGNLELAMLYSELPETALQYLKTVKIAVSDAIERVRLLQRFGEKRQDNRHNAVIDLNSILIEVINQSRPLWKNESEKKGLSILIKTKYGELPKIIGNNADLRTVLYNIMKNSVEAMPEGGIIMVETLQKKENIYITFTDSGMGMNEETRARLFQPFYSTKGLEVGRGFGMTSAHAIIKEHGGEIYVKNTIPGKGTTIEIVIPISKSNKFEIKEPEYKNSDFKSTLSVLWVEDDPSIRKLVSEMAKFLGHKVDVANSGIEALRRLEQIVYDLVITDIGMPEMNGWQLADIISEKFRGKLKVAIASGWGHQISDAEKIEHGVHYIVSKPFGMAQLKILFDEVAQLNLK